MAWWWPFTQSKALEKQTTDAQTLSDIVRGITHSAVSAHDVVDQQFFKTIQRFFTVDAKGVFHPKTARLRVSDTHYMDVPLITMLDPNQLQLDEMDVHMAVRLTRSEVKKALHGASGDEEVSRAAFNVSLVSAKPGSRQDVIDVKMKFKRTEPVEAMAQLDEELRSHLTPKPFTDDDPKVSPPTGFVSGQDRGTEEFFPTDLP